MQTIFPSSWLVAKLLTKTKEMRYEVLRWSKLSEAVKTYLVGFVKT
jgi:hypothetical protein